MTLATRMIIKEPVPTEALFHFIRDELLGGTTEHFDHLIKDDIEEWRSFGVGLPSIIEVESKPDSLMQHEHDKYCAPGVEDREDCWTPTLEPYAIEIRFDTAYGYQGPNGDSSCDALHAWLIRETGRWVEAHGAKHWWWHHEYSGTWYTQDEPVTRLGNPDKGALVEVVR